MADKKLKRKVPPEKKKSGGIRKRWITNNIIIVMAIVAVILIVIGVVMHNSYYESVKNNLEIRANTQARYINTYRTSSYSDFYEYSRQAVQTFSDSEQGVVAVSVGNQSAGTKILLKDKSGKAIIEYAPELSFEVVILSSPDIVSGETYTITVGSESEEFTAK